MAASHPPLAFLVNNWFLPFFFFLFTSGHAHTSLSPLWVNIVLPETAQSPGTRSVSPFLPQPLLKSVCRREHTAVCSALVVAPGTCGRPMPRPGEGKARERGGWISHKLDRKPTWARSGGRTLCSHFTDPLSTVLWAMSFYFSLYRWGNWIRDVKELVFVCMLSRFSCVPLFATLWTIALQAPLSMGFSRKEYWRGLPCPPPGDLPGIQPSYVSCIARQVLYH